MLRDRFLSALVLAPLVLGLAYLGGLWFLGLMLLVGVLAGWEYFSLLAQGDHTPLRWLGPVSYTHLTLPTSVLV